MIFTTIFTTSSPFYGFLFASRTKEQTNTKIISPQLYHLLTLLFVASYILNDLNHHINIYSGIFQLFVSSLITLVAGIVLAILFAIPGVALAGCKYNMGILCKKPNYIIFPAVLFVIWIVSKCGVMFNIFFMNKELSFGYKIAESLDTMEASVHDLPYTTDQIDMLEESENAYGIQSSHQDETHRRYSVYERGNQTQSKRPQSGILSLRGVPEYEIAIKKFNGKPQRAIEYIIQNKHMLLNNDLSFDKKLQIKEQNKQQIKQQIEQQNKQQENKQNKQQENKQTFTIDTLDSSDQSESPIQDIDPQMISRASKRIDSPPLYASQTPPRKERDSKPNATTPLLNNSELKRSGTYSSPTNSTGSSTIESKSSFSINPPSSILPDSIEANTFLGSSSSASLAQPNNPSTETQPQQEKQKPSTTPVNPKLDAKAPWPPKDAFPGMAPEKVAEIIGGDNDGRLTSREINNLAMLLQDERISRIKLGAYLGHSNNISKQVLAAWVSRLNFAGLDFDTALRQYLNCIVLPAETEKIDRLMEAFARHYYNQNPSIFKNSDAAYVFAFAVLMLHTDAHSPNLKGNEKMSKQQFANNLRGINDGSDLPSDLINSVYDRIVAEEMMAGVAKRGWLYKHSRPGRGGTHQWNKKWCIVTNECMMYYFNKPDDKDPRLIIPLEGLDILPASSGSKQHCFVLQDPVKPTVKSAKKLKSGQLEVATHENFLFATESAEEQESWIKAIKDNIARDPYYAIMKRKLVALQKGKHETPTATPRDSSRNRAMSIPVVLNEPVDE